MDERVISFIQPSRNNLKYLKWSYRSIRKNLGYRHEICWADDFSDDGTWEWMNEIKEKDPNVKIHRNEGPTRLGHTILYDTLINDYAINDHRHCHKNPSGSRSQVWHQDSIDGAQIQQRHGTSIKQILMMYYPQDVDDRNGPTAIIPGSHLLSNHSRDRTASQGNFKHQVLGKLNAGSVILLHYDIWHAGTKNVSGKIRYMLKFLFDRTSDS